MPLAPGTRLGPYEIVALVGAGGMGEVYRARDARLDRSVAVKVLPAHVSGKPELRERFEREAKAVSSITHPNICTLHDVGTQDGVHYIVMEYLEGETLAARLARGPLPAAQALARAVEIAGALDRAHRSGVVHRDLKPGNVMLTRSGAKLLDFGLAKLKAQGSEAPAAELTARPTEQRDLTAEGAIMGTFQYMAPEQLEGREADARTDLFAFGAVLYEMLTGRRAFQGKSQASLIASILAAEPPPMAALQPMTPPALERVVRRCLAKDPEERWQSAADLAAELRWIASEGAGAAPAARSRRPRPREAVAWGLAALFLAAASAAVLLRPPPDRTVARLQVLPPAETVFDSIDGPVALSPDGRRMAFVANDLGGASHIWIRSIDSLEAVRLDGTEDAYDPFWSPDGRYVAFGVGTKLWRTEVPDGPPQMICDMPDGRGGAWNTEGVILFAKSGGSPIFRIPAGGGTPEPVTVLDSSRRETGHWRPRFLPDGRRFIFLARSAEPRNSGIYAGSLDSKETTRIADIDVAAAYAPPGFLLFVRDRTLMAQRFDAGRLVLSGDPFPVARGVEYVPTYGAAGFSTSDDLTLAYQGGERVNRRLVWYDRTGREQGSLGEPAEYDDDPRLSPDGRRAAVSIVDPESRGKDIWLLDIGRGTRSRLTFELNQDESPVWSPDGTKLAFSSNRQGIGDLYVRPSSGAGAEEVVLESDLWKRPLDWSPDGRYLLFAVTDPTTKSDLWLLHLGGERAAEPLLKSPFSEIDARFSPDGKWMAYTSDESGRREVYVQRFPPTGEKWQVSTSGGTTPRWRGDGKEIFYVQAAYERKAVDVRTEPSFDAGAPKDLFETRLSDGSDVLPDGGRFLVNMPVPGSTPSPITVVLNWTADLRK